MQKKIFLLLPFFISCTNSIEIKSNMEKAMDLAGSNKIELEKVIQCYSQKPEDSLKLQAAYFLIENMPYHYYYEGESLDSILIYYELLSENKNIKPQILLDSLEKIFHFSLKNLNKRYDIQTLDSVFICKNIEFSFKVWEEQPWGKNVSFDDFCKYILPYRIGTEKPVLWKEQFYNKYNSILKESGKFLSFEKPLDALLFLMDSLTKKDFLFTTIAPIDIPNIGPYYSEFLCGSCRDFTDYSVYICRSLGIPCAIDFMPLRGNVNDGHMWTVYMSEGQLYVQDFPYAIHPIREDKIMRESKLKVYRQQFFLNKKMQQEMEHLEKSIYPFFEDPKFEDVTIFYSDCYMDNFFVPESILYKKARTSNIAYLCLSKRMGWEPVAWTKFNPKKLNFKGIQKGIVVRVATWENNQLSFQTNPFIINYPEGEIISLQKDTKTQDVILFSKTNLDTENDFIKRIVDGVFEGSNTPCFKDVDTLFLVKKESPRLFTTIKLNSCKKYRYVRYRGPDNSYCNIAEVSFFGENDSLLYGKIIGTEGDWGNKGTHTYLNVFDNKTETSFDYKQSSGGWSGLDLISPQRITKIVYTPRNRDNYVRPKDVYELFFFDKEWKSLGVQESSSDSLLYKNVPHNVLFYLRNYTRGVDERIFIYENNKVKFL